MAERTLDDLRVIVLNWRDRTHPLAGGAEEYAHRIAESLHAAGARVTFFAARVDGQPTVSRVAGITLVRKGSRWTVYLWALAWLLANRRSVDVVVDCQNGIPFFSPLALSRRTNVVLVMHHVHDRQFGVHFPFWLARIGRWLEGPAARRVYRNAVTVAVSPSTVLAMRTRLGWRGPTFVIPNGMVSQPVDARPRVIEPTLVCLGRLVTQKRVDRLIDTVAALRTHWPTLRLHVIGRGPEENSLRAKAGDGVVVHGYLDESAKAELLAEAWLGVTLSDGEGWGLSVLETAAHGVPTVCRDVDGLRDSVRHGETGWLIADGESAAHAIDAALARLSDEGAAVTVAKACREWAERFDWMNSGRRFCRLVSDLVAGRVCREWTTESLVAEFGWPLEQDVATVLGNLGAHATARVHEGAGWLLAEQCRPGDVLAALAGSDATDVRVRPADEVERLLGSPGCR